MPATRPPKISNQEWEDQKSVIERLFLRERRGLRDEHDKEGIISYMSRERSFTATLSQYEARLKQWNFRKNINTTDWIEIAKLIQRREQQGKNSAVFLSGVPLENTQVSKGISRSAVRDAVRDAVRESAQKNLPIHHLPPWVEVRTPQLGPHGDDRHLQPTTYSLESSFPHHQDPVAQGASTTFTNPISSPLDLDHSLDDTYEALNSHSQVLFESETQIVRRSSFSSGVLPLDPQKPWTCASPIYPGGPAEFISHTVLGKLNSRVGDLLSMMSHMGKDSGLVIDSKSVSEQYQRRILNVLPMRYSYNFANMAQSSDILQLAIYEIANGDFQSRDLRITTKYGEPTTNEVPLDYHKPVMFALAYFQQGSLHPLQNLRKYLPFPYLEVVFRNLFTVALEAHAYKVLDWLLLHSDTISRISNTRVENYRHHLSCVMGEGPMSLAMSISAQFGERAIDWFYLSQNFNEDPGEKLFDMLSRGIRPNWGCLLPRMADSLLEKVIHQIPAWASELSLFETQTLILSCVRKMSEADALRNIDFIIRMAQPAVTRWLIHPEQPPLEETKEDTPGIYRIEAKEDVLAAAVARGFDTVIDLLISTGFQDSGNCLCEALHTERMDLIEKLLSHGSSPWSIANAKSLNDDPFGIYPPWKVSNRNSTSVTTPYAEAIRLKMTTALQLFDETPYSFPRGSLVDAVVFTIIVAASECGNEKILRRFLQAQLLDPPFMPDPEDWFPHLREAARRATKNHHMNILTLLLQAGVPQSIGTLECAIRSRNAAMITKIFDINANCFRPRHELHRDMQWRVSYYNDAILNAIDYGDQETLSAVLDCIDFRDQEYPGDFLIAAIVRGSFALVKDLIQRGVHPNDMISMEKDQKSLASPLVVAIRSRNKQIITLLLDEHAWTNPEFSEYSNIPDSERKYRCTSALEAAATNLDAELIEELLRRGAYPCDSRAILILDEARCWESLERLFRQAEGQSRTVKTDLLWHALLTAVDSTNFNLLRRLLPHVNQHVLFQSRDEALTKDCRLGKLTQSSHDQTQGSRLNILSFAIDRCAQKRCSIGMIPFLLGFENDIERVCFECYIKEWQKLEITYASTPLQNAILLRSRDCVDVLISSGANINRDATNATKYTALQLAVDIGDVEMVSYLLNKGALVNAPPAPLQGLTALQLAAKHGFYRIAEILIDAKADVDAPRAKVGGRTAFEAATEYGRLDMMGLLVKNGALSIDMELQYERAVKFAKARGHDPAVEHAGQLRTKILEARDAAEKELQEYLAYPMSVLDTAD